MARFLDDARFLAQRARNVIGAFRQSELHRSIHLGGLAQVARSLRTWPRGPSSLIRFHACNIPDKTALVDGEARLTYAELEDAINQMANALRGLGVGPGDRVGLMMRNCHQYLVSQWAITRLGAVTVQIGYRLKTPEVVHILENSEPRVVIFHRDYEDVVRAARKSAGAPDERCLVRVPDGFSELSSAASREPPPRQSGEELGGVMVYTSGTTGKPKGATRKLGKSNLHPAVVDFLKQIGIHHHDRHLVICPLYHSAAPAFMAFTLLFGGTVVVEDHFEPERTLELLARERITSTFMVPTMLGRIAALPEEIRRRHDTSSLRWVLSGAAPLPTDTARRFEETFGRVLYNFYGATETGLVTLAGPGEHTARPGTIGRALLGNEIRLLGEDGAEVPTGETGELWVRNSMLVEGYYRMPDATRSAMRDGFFSVGDMGHVDADGYYYLDDRKSDMVISGGVNIYPMEIEQHLHAHPAVMDAAVVGVPDPDWGESLKAFVVVRPGHTLSEAEVVDHCKAGLANFKCPKTVEFLDALPRNPTGKVLKRELRTR